MQTEGLTSEKPAKPHQLKKGTILKDRYRIGDVLGQGGFGITYSGYDERLNIKIAIKEYYPSGYAIRTTNVSNVITIVNKDQQKFIQNGMERFLSEAKSLARFQQFPGIVSVRDYFEENDTAYIVMELLDGVDLKFLIKNRLFDAEELFSMLEPVFDALIMIHSEGIIHRDISPDNIFILNNGSAKLMDFGAARQTNQDDQRSISVVLKNGYAPEEQYRAKGKQGPWTDIYALCATIYKCITGKVPEEALERQRLDELKSPSELGINISSNLERVLMKGLSVNASDRFQSVLDMKRAINGDWDGLEDEEEDEDEVTVAITDGQLNENKENNDTEIINKGGNKKKWIAAGIAALMVVILAALFLLLSKNIKKSDSNSSTDLENQQTTLTSENVDEVEIEKTESSENDTSRSDMYELIFTPSTEITINDFNNASKIIKSRLEAISCKDDIETILEGTNIKAFVPKKSFYSQEDMLSLVEWFAADSFNCRAIVQFENEDGNVDYESIDDINDALKSFELVKGTIPSLNVDEAVYDDDFEYKGGDYTFVRIELSDEYWEKYGTSIKEGTARLYFGVYKADVFGSISGMEYDAAYISDGVLGIYSGSGIEWEQMSGIPCTMSAFYHNMTSNNITREFKVYSPWNDIEWETDDNTRIPGKNQCNIDELGEEYIISKYECYSYMSEGEYLDLISGFKNRLDSMEVPYSYGREVVNNPENESESAYNNYIYVAINSRYAGNIVNAYLTHNGDYSLCAGEYKYNLSDNNVSLKHDENGSWVEVNVKDYEKKGLEYFTRYMLEEGNENFFLGLGAYSENRFLQTSIKEVVDNGIIRFRDTVYETEGDWQWKIIESLFDEKSSLGESRSNISFYGAQYPNNNGSMLDVNFGAESKFNLSKEEDAIKEEICRSAELSYNEDDYDDGLYDGERSQLYVRLNLNVDEDFASKTESAVRDIINKFNVNDYYYLNHIYIVPTQTDDITDEVFDIEFYRHYKNVDLITGEDKLYEEYINDLHERNDTTLIPFIRMEINMKNGRLEEYVDEFKKQIKADDLFKKCSITFNGEEM